ncbi:sterol desaturase family protein [Tomitella biformata]|uniref:sterol desaturase family protein n=1 Tax=Tomitella biformata TaxID=630403 RepID=UPI000464C94F|nr:sterol desaturase family protein [Tomitella biformata]
MWETLSDSWASLLDPLRDPVTFAIPAFVVFLLIEWGVAIARARSEATANIGASGMGPSDMRAHPPVGGYDAADARASIGMGLVSIATLAAWKALALIGYAAVYVYIAPWHLPPGAWYTWLLLIVGVDLLYYAYHRMAHRVRLMWATHQAHHSSEHYNLATALRQKWNNSGEILMFLPLPLLGMPPALVFVGFSVSLVYQFFIHTERVQKLPRPIEFLFNTPSHHRVHHGRDQDFLDRNYGGILIIWDRMFGTFTPETRRPLYGLTQPVDTNNLWRLQVREYQAIARDWRGAKGWRAKLGHTFGPPGWAPEPDPAAEPSRSRS